MEVEDEEEKEEEKEEEQPIYKHRQSKNGFFLIVLVATESRGVNSDV